MSLTATSRSIRTTLRQEIVIDGKHRRRGRDSGPHYRSVAYQSGDPRPGIGPS